MTSHHVQFTDLDGVRNALADADYLADAGIAAVSYTHLTLPTKA